MKLNSYSLRLYGGFYFGFSGLLGFKRGLQNYDYEYNKQIKRYPLEKQNYLYVRAALDGVFGLIFYGAF